MNIKVLLFSALALSLTIVSCDKNEDDVHVDVPSYNINIISPNTDDKHVGDTLEIEVEFSEIHDDVIHHINIEIKNRDSGTVIYSRPNVAHVHEESGLLVYTDSFVLSNANGVEAHSNWVLTATVWGHEEGIAEHSEEIEFHVHP
jgi:hypothetical protein